MTARLPWFRMFTEARNDSKLDALNDREFRIWHKLLCYAAEGTERGTVDYIDPEFVAMELRVGVDELESAISRMVRLRLVERSEARVMFPSFTGRQYDKPSDRPEAVRERVRKSRAKAKGEPVSPPYRGVTRRTEQNKSKPEGVLGEIRESIPADPERVKAVVAEIRQGLTR